MIKSTNLIEKRIEKKKVQISMDHLEQAIEMATDENTPKDDKEILEGIINFSLIPVNQVMKSRLDMVAVDSEDYNFHQILAHIKDSGFSRIPVYKETLDKIEGILYVKDLLIHLDKPKGFNWQSLAKPVFYVPENKKIDDLLRDFQEKRVHIAIVVDEYGGTSGLITMEDILEEIVGEIMDEFDDEPVDYEKIDEKTYIFEGKTSLLDLCRIVQIDVEQFEPVKGESESLAGFLLELHQKIPEKDKVLQYNNMTFTILLSDRKKIKKIKFEF